MKFAELLNERTKYNEDKRTVTMVFLGDSVTQGCFELYDSDDGILHSVQDQQNVYHAKLQKLLSGMFPETRFHFVNAGVEGNCAFEGLDRVKTQVLVHDPDIVVVCFGLNDAVSDVRTPKEYGEVLKCIFQKLKEQSCEIIFMTPNMMNLEVHEEKIPASIVNFAYRTRETQRNGTMDLFMDEARKICKENGVKLCDCYAKWKNMYKAGIDTNELLSNYINHPKREMHEIFAYSLLETMLYDL